MGFSGIGVGKNCFHGCVFPVPSGLEAASDAATCTSETGMMICKWVYVYQTPKMMGDEDVSGGGNGYQTITKIQRVEGLSTLYNAESPRL